MDTSSQKSSAPSSDAGCRVVHVTPEGERAPFTYSVGIQKIASAPEAVVVGLREEIAHLVVHEYHRRTTAGEVFVAGQKYSGFLQGFEMAVERVEPAFFSPYLEENLDLYNGPHFEALQLIYPDMVGAWPWQTEASEWFRAWQTILTRSPLSPHQG